MNSISDVWQSVLSRLQEQLSETTIRTWFDEVDVVTMEDSAFVLHCSNSFKKSTIETRFMKHIKAALKDIFSSDLEVKILNDEQLAAYHGVAPDQPGSLLDSDAFTFETYVVGPQNKLAYAAARAVADKPAENFNPLFIYGDSGLGKTHLLYAIAHQVKRKREDLRIVYIKGDDFTNELIASIREGSNAEFREKYRQAGILLVDDIQFIAGKLTVQEEFFHTFDTLFKMNKQIILASDRAPKDIDNLEDRLKSRFVMGLVTDIQPPDLDLRVAIFKRKSIDMGFDLDSSVLYFLARNITTNIRQIEGSLKKLRAHTLVTGQRVDYNVAKAVLSDFFANAKSEESTIDRIFEYTEKRYGITKDEMKSSKRNADIAAARHTTMYLIRKTTSLSQSSIAKIFNKKDHTTVINSISTVERKMLNDPGFEREIKQAIASLI